MDIFNGGPKPLYTQTISMNLSNSYPQRRVGEGGPTASVTPEPERLSGPLLQPGKSTVSSSRRKAMKWVQVDPSEIQGDWRFRNSSMTLGAPAEIPSTNDDTSLKLTVMSPRGNHPPASAQEGSFISFSLGPQAAIIPKPAKKKATRRQIRVPVSNSNSGKAAPRKKLVASSQRLIPARSPSPPTVRYASQARVSPSYRPTERTVNYRARGPLVFEIPRLVMPQRRLPPGRTDYYYRQGANAPGGICAPSSRPQIPRLSLMRNVTSGRFNRPSLLKGPQEPRNLFKLAPVDWSKTMPSLYGAHASRSYATSSVGDSNDDMMPDSSDTETPPMSPPPEPEVGVVKNRSFWDVVLN